MPTARLNGIDVYYERRGDGPPVLFLNGSGSTLDGMRVLLDVFTDRVDLLAHDQRGLGRTEIPPGPYSMADYAADAIALLDHVGWERARVVGISFGGMVAQELAVTVPDRVEKLALLCTSPGGATGVATRSTRWPRSAEAERAERYLTDPRHPLHRRLARASTTRTAALVEMLAARQLGEKSAEVQRGEAEQLAARAGHDVFDRLAERHRTDARRRGSLRRHRARCPNSEAIAARIPGAELRVYEGGHAFFAQDRRALPEVLDFLAG